MNRLPTAKRVQVVSALIEGNSINAIVRMTNVAKHTVLKLVEDMGCACTAYRRSRVDPGGNDLTAAARKRLEESSLKGGKPCHSTVRCIASTMPL